MADGRPLISVVDDDESVRESLPDLLRSFGYDVETFCSAEEFLRSPHLGRTRCLLLDIAMPGMSGPELFQSLTATKKHIPVVFITGVEDETVRSRLILQGATDCLFKPFGEEALQEAVKAALGLT
ncbi:response regulator [Rhizobium ruizarguesonis]|uniref:response regulator n=1 Tax=Rhizobium ruizarguesonis TaxID=2081791 RepID=UPI001031BAD6|nr:response regulator [Rhizobium ruizarguesonis]TAV98413.1 response regulator [Rhizobium ruizarguesonis]TAW15906.1 response regulator [Rhizobium ruizarguesonis]TBC98748.1 response regulator [Rhizobium ruizarguesonis]TBD15585.1 response regulator [Rhizobium ruizarguesonis]TBE96641.1 response regulator [Rhizobium ruizarguesonis]